MAASLFSSISFSFFPFSRRQIFKPIKLLTRLVTCLVAN